MRWSEASTLDFVKSYLKNECLWNPEDPSYKNRPARESAYSGIAVDFKQSTGLSISSCEVKRKIKNLRTTYSQQVHKILNRSRDPDQLYQPSLVWFNHMDACLKHLSNKHIHMSYLNTKFKRAPSEETSDKVWMQTVCEESRPDPLVPPPPQPSPPPAPPHAPLERRQRVSSSAPLINFKLKKKKKLKLLRERPNPVYKDSSSDVELQEDSRTSIAVPIEDEFEIYGKYIASQLRKMDLQKALRLQMDINTLVGGARLADIEDG